MFVLGFVADPIINLYIDPYSTLSSVPGSQYLDADEDSSSWTEHFVKGLASLGLLGFVKFFFTLGPWQWWNLRNTGLVGGNARAGTTGRDRLANISWVVVLIGIATFLFAVWKGVRAWSRRTLEAAGERVVDVQLDGDDDDNDEAD
ncbi:hypothetical protein B0A49_06963 [Cryomyces minteri]|uniref:Uncharacterized protein n=1 Tax=Cryomyces minteri TaxID=331657 RepID=A0A4U0W7H8_9PEZI|nr:hypothetical protein B0A49_06963 [Cryomyces minteri]